MSKLRGTIEDVQIGVEDEETVTVHYKITPGKPGVPYDASGDPGSAPEGDEIEIEIEDKNGKKLDRAITMTLIDMCFEHSRGSIYDKYNDD